MAAKTLPLALVLIIIAACHPTSRVVPNGARIEETTVDGKLVYTRGDQKIAHGMFGGGLEEAVAGNADAEEEARQYFRRNVTAKLLAIASVGLLVNGFVFGYEREPGESGEFTTTGNVLLALSLTAFLTSGYFYRSGQAHRYDAINIYNNAVESR